jgi:hypothetical protein
MSNLLSTSAMTAECQTRVPIGLSTTFWMKKLNEAYRWICQKGHFVWEMRRQEITIPAGATSFALPATMDPGKPMYLGGPYDFGNNPESSILSILPLVPAEDALDQQLSEMADIKGLFSCWSLIMDIWLTKLVYFAALRPWSAANTSDALSFQFHFHEDASSTELTVGADKYFPTPNVFDNLLIELAEAEVRRIYGLAGWEIIQKRAESTIMVLLDKYRSSKSTVVGLSDQQKQTSERKLMAQERA